MASCSIIISTLDARYPLPPERGATQYIGSRVLPGSNET